MSDELRVPGYVTEHDVLFFKAREDLSEADATALKERFLNSARTDQPVVLAGTWTAEEVDAAAQRAYAAFWGVLGPVSEQWAFMSEERKECWRGVVRAVRGE